MTRMLELRDVHAYYGKSHVLHGVDLHVDEGEIVAILGRNGAGRSTILKAIVHQVDRSGAIDFKGESLLPLTTFQVARRGVGYVPEAREVFSTLTVEQNLMLGMKSTRPPGPGQWTLADMYRMFPRLQERQHTAAGVLSGGEQQMLTLCRSLMGNPDVILIDEPTEGLAPRIVEQVAAYLRVLKQRRMSVVLVEQKLSIALDVADRVYVIGHGRVVFEGTPAELRSHPSVSKEWLEV
ncbi:ABC transporter ATP-binding protein [Hydrogenophaga laconesensis]|uniref:Branched-chain amino acid transport system ATP-binding protein n=1 Tax=Hydrogenophaga laconesensis TaxID=1805971 RepID=A0ABU1VJ00_9BURK|nr:ABC transporter ATP-binding protein [Hydrogenophaga laconesensis]MDR7097449.1 branched-chain amino acid transport system ATP-binding protein [Hydrogenophaga laconesensis]